MEVLDGSVCGSVKNLRSKSDLVTALKPIIGSKQFGFEDILSELVADACLTVMPLAPKKPSINLDNVRISKVMGGSVYDAEVVKGMVVQRNTEGAIKRVEKAKVAVFGCGIEASSTEAKSTVLINNAEELMNYSKGEEERMEEAIRGIAESGAKVVIAGGSIRYVS